MLTNKSQGPLLRILLLRSKAEGQKVDDRRSNSDVGKDLKMTSFATTRLIPILKILGFSGSGPSGPRQYRTVMPSRARLEVSVVALWPWLLKSTACNNFYCAEIIYSICLHNSSSGQQLVIARMNVVSCYYFHNVQFWFLG